MKRKLICALLASVLVLTGVTGMWGGMGTVYGEKNGGNASVKLPDFPVTLNGQKVNNDSSKYPLIVYKDITYFPMTFMDCRFLGIESVWKGDKEGLYIDKTGVTAAYQSYNGAAKNGRSYTASIPQFPISVNGKVVENGKEEYPLLSFRDITYFPMTWKFAVSQFGWGYSFDKANGLVIKSDNPFLSQTAIVKNRPKEDGHGIYKGKPSTQVTVTDKNVYYSGNKGKIMQAPLSDTAKEKAVHQLNLANYGTSDFYDEHKLFTKDGKAILDYHEGGALMGGDITLRLNDDGTTSDYTDGQVGKAVFGDKSFSWWVGPAPNSGNLTMQKGDGESVPMGDPDILYGWKWTADPGGSNGGGGSPRAYLVGEELYILGFPYIEQGREDEKKGKREKCLTTGVYRVNINTGKTERVTEEETMNFTVEGDFLYYGDYSTIYRLSLKTGEKTSLKTVTNPPYGSLYDMEVLNGTVYYMLKNIKPSQSSHPYETPIFSMGKLIHGKESDGASLMYCDSPGDWGEQGMAIMGTTEKYFVCTFIENQSTPYRIMVYDAQGDLVFKTSDKAYVRNINIIGNNIYFYNITAGTVCSAKLK